MWTPSWPPEHDTWNIENSTTCHCGCESLTMGGVGIDILTFEVNHLANIFESTNFWITSYNNLATSQVDFFECNILSTPIISANTASIFSGHFVFTSTPIVCDNILTAIYIALLVKWVWQVSRWPITVFRNTRGSPRDSKFHFCVSEPATGVGRMVTGSVCWLVVSVNLYVGGWDQLPDVGQNVWIQRGSCVPSHWWV